MVQSNTFHSADRVKISALKRVQLKPVSNHSGISGLMEACITLVDLSGAIVLYQLLFCCEATEMFSGP